MALPQTLLSSEIAAGTKLPPLRYPVSATTVVLGAMASRDWRPMHHDRDFAINRNGVKDIFLNTPTQAGWLERYLFDWSGPGARLAKMRFAMKESIFPGTEMRFSGNVTEVAADTRGDWAWVDVKLAIHVDGDTLATECEARLALPVHPEINLWSVPTTDWNP